MSGGLQRFRRRLAAEKRKAGVLALLLVVGLLLWGRVLSGRLPRPTHARQPAAQRAPQQQDDPAARPPSWLRRPVVEVALSRAVDRDPFEIDRERFEPAAGAAVVEPVEDPRPTASELDRQMHRRVEAEAAGLKLQGTLLSGRPRAMINGSLVRRGQRISGFEVLDIRSRRVTLRKEGVVVVLEMPEHDTGWRQDGVGGDHPG